MTQEQKAMAWEVLTRNLIAMQEDEEVLVFNKQLAGIMLEAMAGVEEILCSGVPK